MLTDSQLFRLQDVLGCLACYANGLFGLVEQEQFMDLMESYDPARVEVIHDVLETLWENADVIDGFVEQNPFGLKAAPTCSWPLHGRTPCTPQAYSLVPKRAKSCICWRGAWWHLRKQSCTRVAPA